MFALNNSQKFYLYNKPADMRKSFNGLSGLILTGMLSNPTSGEVFIFINKKNNMMKLLHWQAGGFVLYFKRLEKGTFKIPGSDKNKITISHAELAMIVEGICVKTIQKNKRFTKL